MVIHPSHEKLKNNTPSCSSVEAEYRSMTTTICELKWLKELLSCFGINHHSPIKLYCDNQYALYIVSNPIFHERTKHIEVECHFVRDELLRAIITTGHVSSHAQLVDILTKALGKTQFKCVLSKLGICNPYTPT